MADVLASDEQDLRARIAQRMQVMVTGQEAQIASWHAEQDELLGRQQERLEAVTQAVERTTDDPRGRAAEMLEALTEVLVQMREDREWREGEWSPTTPAWHGEPDIATDLPLWEAIQDIVADGMPLRPEPSAVVQRAVGGEPMGRIAALRPAEPVQERQEQGHERHATLERPSRDYLARLREGQPREQTLEREHSYGR